MIRLVLALAIFAAASPAAALDPACVNTPNLAIPKCPDDSEDWYESYTSIVDNLDILGGLTQAATITANAPILGDGSVGDPIRLDSSSVTLQGNAFNGANQLLKLDGSGKIPGSLNSAISTHTFISGTFATSAVDFGPCIDGSTITMTTAGGPVEVSFHGILANVTNNKRSAIVYLRDGDFVDGYSISNGAFNILSASGDEKSAIFSHISQTPISAGSHSWCLSIRQVDGGTAQLLCGPPQARCDFSVKELH